MTFPTYKTHYYCKLDEKWILKSEAKIINNTPYCSECGKKLRTKRQKYTGEQKKELLERTEIIYIMNELESEGVRFSEYNQKCRCAFCRINYNLTKRIRLFVLRRTGSQAQKERFRKPQLIEVKV